VSGEYRCECCGVDLENQRALWLEDATLCYPCAVDLGYLVRANPDKEEHESMLAEMYRRQALANTPREQPKASPQS